MERANGGSFTSKRYSLSDKANVAFVSLFIFSFVAVIKKMEDVNSYLGMHRPSGEYVRDRGVSWTCTDFVTNTALIAFIKGHFYRLQLLHLSYAFLHTRLQ